MSNDTIEVIDISGHQPIDAIDYAAAAADGLEAVIVKQTEGNTHTSPTWFEHSKRVHAAGLLLGAYHFAWPNEPIQRDAVAEATRFVDRIREMEDHGIYQDVLPTLDLEKGKRRLSGENLLRWTARCVNEIADALSLPRIMVYANRSYVRALVRGAKAIGSKLGLERHALWIAGDAPRVPPGIWAEAALWQTPRRKVPWCTCDVDLDDLVGPLDAILIRHERSDGALDEAERHLRAALGIIAARGRNGSAD